MEKLRLLPEIPIAKSVESVEDGFLLAQNSKVLIRVAIDTLIPFPIGHFQTNGSVRIQTLFLLLAILLAT